VQRGSVAGEDGWILVNRGLRKLFTSKDGNVAGAVCSETGMRGAYQKYRQMMNNQPSGEQK
jgi:hypothetical protein